MIDKAFRENGVTIPFPQRDLRIIQPNYAQGAEIKVEQKKPEK